MAELPAEGWTPDLWTGEGVDELDLEQQKLAAGAV